MRIGLFVTCLADVGFPEVGKAVVDVLEQLGHTVEFPTGQTCCGQMHVNTGYRSLAAPLIRGTVEALSPYDVVVTPSASCAGVIRQDYPRLASQIGAGELVERATQVSERVYEFSELLCDVLEVEDVGATFERTVAYHPTCHSLRHLRVGDRPQRLLRAVRGLHLVELDRSDECCGFGGTFALKNSAVSTAMGLDKVAAVRASGAEVLAAADASCLSHIGGLLHRGGHPVETMHLAQILAKRAP